MIVLVPLMVVNVPSGQVGVLWKRFGGTELDPRYLRNEGLNIILPWDKLFLYQLRIQSATQTYNAISSDGVNLTAAINMRFRLRREFIPQLHQAIGPDYANLLGPEIASRMREVISQYTAEQVYSTERQKIQEEIKNRVIAKLGERFLERDGVTPYRIPIRDVGVLYDTLLHEIRLPDAVVTAINRKAEQYYISQEYVYRVERERRESERKKIEAEGIRDFQQTVSQGISNSYLRWRGIEATLEMARSNNAKIVIIGGGKDGLPIILGNVDGPVAPPPAAAPGGGAAAPPSGTAPGSGALPGAAAPAPGGAGPAPAQGSKQDNRSQLPSGYFNAENLLSRLWPRSPATPESGAAPGPRPETSDGSGARR
ncbi:MAG: prohibitin family protein [Xanthobacteraceae bacterium]